MSGQYVDIVLGGLAKTGKTTFSKVMLGQAAPTEYEQTTTDSIHDTVMNVGGTDYKISFNEYMTHNKRSHYISDGAYYDWIELVNNSDKDLNLDGLYLTDDKRELNKFKLPDVVLKKNEYLVIYLTGGIKVDGYICANFKIGDNDNVILSNNDKIVDEIKLVTLPNNVSYGKKDNKWQYFTTGTPGKDNTTKGFDEIGGINGST